jgi:DNA-binding SARP family transcriptional activator
VSRDELVELLWGRVAGSDDKVGHRLAVALSTARGVLDPRRLAPADHFIGAGPANLWLNVDRLSIDVERFLSEARHGLTLYARGPAEPARAVLAGVEQTYRAEVFADDPYDDWARPLRDEVAATHLDVLRALAKLASDAGDTGEAAGHLTRVLAADPYDEGSHRDLVRTLAEAGRHGEARRAHMRYLAAMREIGVPVAEADRVLR